MSSIVSTLMLQRGLRPLPELATERPHGDRLRYLAGCRCSECRAANTAYFHQREQAKADGNWNGFVPADKARQHMVELSAKGIGRRAVAPPCSFTGTSRHAAGSRTRETGNGWR